MHKKVEEVVDLILANDPAWKDKLAENWQCIWRLNDFHLIEVLLSQFNPGVQVGANLVDPEINGVEIGHVIAAYGAGTAYSLTNTQAAINLGTTDPAIVIDEPGTYLVSGQLLLAYNGATVVAETATVKVRRTNNTPADVSAAPLIDLPVSTTLTHAYGTVVIPPFIYQTSNSDDALSLFGAVSAALGAGTIDAVAVGTAILAQRIAGYTP